MARRRQATKSCAFIRGLYIESQQNILALLMLRLFPTEMHMAYHDPALLYPNDRVLRTLTSTQERIEYLMQKHLPPPYPASPTRPPIAAVRFTVPDKFMEIHCFAEFYSAKYWVKNVINERKFHWEDERNITVYGDHYNMQIKSDQLEEIMEHKLNRYEREWVPQFHDRHVIEKLKSFDTIKAPVHETPARAMIPDKPKRVKRAQSRKAPLTGQITVAQIADEFDISAGKARQLLRKASYTKPDHGWSFATDDPELKKVRTILKKGTK